MRSVSLFLTMEPFFWGRKEGKEGRRRGAEGKREGGKEGGRERGREGKREGGKEGGRCGDSRTVDRLMQAGVMKQRETSAC